MMMIKMIAMIMKIVVREHSMYSTQPPSLSRGLSRGFGLRYSFPLHSGDEYDHCDYDHDDYDDRGNPGGLTFSYSFPLHSGDDDDCDDRDNPGGPYTPHSFLNPHSYRVINGDCKL